VGYWFQRLARFAPCRQPAHDDEGVESFFPQEQRHPGAGRLACSSTVKVYVLIFGEILQLLGKIVRFDANGSLNARSVGIVIAVAPDVDDEISVPFFRLEFTSQLLYLHTRHHAINLILAVEPHAVRDVDEGRHEKYFCKCVAGCLESTRDGRQEIAGEESQAAISQDIK